MVRLGAFLAAGLLLSAQAAVAKGTPGVTRFPAAVSDKVLQDFLQGPLGLGATWKLVLGLVFVVLVVFLRDGILGGIRDLYRLVARRKAEKATSIAAPAKAPARPPAAAPATVRTHAGNGFSGPIMQTISLTKHYGGLAANEAIDFAVDAGEVRGIIGPNGAGKTTFFKVLTCEVSSRAATSPAWT